MNRLILTKNHHLVEFEKINAEKKQPEKTPPIDEMDFWIVDRSTAMESVTNKSRIWDHISVEDCTKNGS